MQLNPTEDDRLRVFAAAQLARTALDRGLALNAPEAIALLCDEMHLTAREGASWQEVRDAAIALAATTPVIGGVPDLVREIRLEVLLDEGSRLVVLRDPFGTGDERIRFGDGDVALVPERERLTLRVTNAGERPIRVSSHFPFWEANANLSFDRDTARGFRLDLPAGDSVRWAPGESREVPLVALAGHGDA
jgi:urease subunit gamma/beta